MSARPWDANRPHIPAAIVAGILRAWLDAGHTQREAGRALGVDESRVRALLSPGPHALVSGTLADRITTACDRIDAWYPGGELANYRVDPPGSNPTVHHDQEEDAA